MHKGHVVLALLFCHLPLVLLFASKNGKNESPQSKFVGTWKLVSIAAQYADGRILEDPDFGPNAKGYLFYAASGHMCVQLMNPNRFDWRNPANPTEREAKAGVAGYGAYCGTYEVHENESVVIDHKELSLVPNAVTTSVARKFSFQGNRLILRAVENTQNARQLEFTLTWERVN